MSEKDEEKEGKRSGMSKKRVLQCQNTRTVADLDTLYPPPLKHNKDSFVSLTCHFGILLVLSLTSISPADRLIRMYHIIR